MLNIDLFSISKHLEDTKKLYPKKIRFTNGYADY